MRVYGPQTMAMRMHRHRLTGPLTLVVLAVVLVLGHICALPETAFWFSDAHGQAPGEPHHDDGAHVASCDATVLKTSSVHVASPDAIGGERIDVAHWLYIDERAARTAMVAPLRRAPDRPLFLQHASFLI